MHGGQTNGAKSRLSLLDSPWSNFGRRRLAKPGGCVRPKRVVSAPVAGAKSAEVLQAQPGFAKPPIADDGDKTNSSPRSARHKQYMRLASLITPALYSAPAATRRPAYGGFNSPGFRARMPAERSFPCPS